MKGRIRHQVQIGPGTLPTGCSENAVELYRTVHSLCEKGRTLERAKAGWDLKPNNPIAQFTALYCPLCPYTTIPFKDRKTALRHSRYESADVTKPQHMDLGEGVIRKLYAVLLTPDIVNEAREFQAAYGLKDPKLTNWAIISAVQQFGVNGQLLQDQVSHAEQGSNY